MPQPLTPSNSVNQNAQSLSPKTRGIQLRADGLTQFRGGRRVITDLSLTLSGADRVGLIGENGAGKSTLLRVLAGIDAPESGTVVSVQDGGIPTRIGLFHQEAPFDEQLTIAEVLETAVQPIREAERALNDAAEGLATRVEPAAEPKNAEPADHEPADSEHSDAEQLEDAAAAYARALDTAERLGVWELDAEIGRTLAGLGIAHLKRSAPVRHLSGGQRARLSLAWLLLHRPEILLLDEPSNHLDDDAVQYVVDRIDRWPGPVLFASHDRSFLERAASSLIDLDPHPMPHALAADDAEMSSIGATRFAGSYREYLAVRREARRRWERQYRDEQAELTRLRQAVMRNQQVGHEEWSPKTEVRGAQKFYADRNAAVVSRRVRDARQRLAELGQLQVRQPPRELQFGGLASGISGEAGVNPLGEMLESDGRGQAAKPLIRLHAAAVDGRLTPVSLSIHARTRLLLTGVNGSGKSTLLAVLAGVLEVTRGSSVRAPDLRVGLLGQDARFGPETPGTVAEVYEGAVGVRCAAELPLASFDLFAPRDLDRGVSELSNGQRRRLELASVIADPPSILLLDEPTNHLSLPAVEAIEQSIESYPGAVVIASHDRWLRERWSWENVNLESVVSGLRVSRNTLSQ